MQRTQFTLYRWRPVRRRRRAQAQTVGDELLVVRRNGQALAALRTTTLQDVASALGVHALAEAVGACALDLARLIRSLHNCLSERNGPG